MCFKCSLKLQLSSTYQTLPNLTLCLSSNKRFENQTNYYDKTQVQKASKTFSDEWFKSECAGNSKFPTNLKFYYQHEMSPKYKVHVKYFKTIIHLFTNHT